MAFTPGRMIVAGQTFAMNPESDTDFSKTLLKTDFVPIGASDSITQIHGMASAERHIGGYFFADADYQQLKASFHRAVPVPCTDWMGNTFLALITSLTPERVNDLAHGFQTVRYKASLMRRPG